MAKNRTKDLIDGIKNKDSKTLNFLYKKYFSLVRSFVLNNNGTTDDAKDVFQEAVIAIFRYSQNENFELKCSFETFLYSICRTIWLNNLRNKRVHLNKINEISEFIIFSSSTNEMIEESLEYKLYQKHFQRLSEECKKLLQLFFDKVSYAEIAKLLGYSSVGFVKKKKFNCKEFLMKSIKNDPEFNRLSKEGEEH